MVQQYKLLILVIGFRIISVSTDDVPPINATVQLDGTSHAKFGDHEDVNNNLASSQVDSKMALVRSTVDLRAKRDTRRTLPTVWKREKRNNMHDYHRRPSGMDYYLNKMQEMAEGLPCDGKEDDESEYSGRHVVYRNADDGRASDSFEVEPNEEDVEEKKNVNSCEHEPKVDERKQKTSTVGETTKASSIDNDDDDENDDDDDDNLEYQNENDKIKINKTDPEQDAADNQQENSKNVQGAKTNSKDTKETPVFDASVTTTEATNNSQDDEEEDYDEDEEDEPDEEEEEEDDGNEEEDDDECDAPKSILGAKEPDDSLAKHNTKSHTNDYPCDRHRTYYRNHGIKTPENFLINTRKLNNVHMKAPQQHSLTHRIKAGDDEEECDSKDKAVLDEEDDDDNRQHEEDSQEEERDEDETNDDKINEDESNEEGTLPTARKREKRNTHVYHRRPSGMDYYLNKMQEMEEGLSSDDKEDDESEYSGRRVVHRNADYGRASDSCEVKTEKENDQRKKNVKSSEHGSKVDVRKQKTGAVAHKTKASSDNNDNSEYQDVNNKVNHIDKNYTQKTSDDNREKSKTLHRENSITADSNEAPGSVATTKDTTKKDDQKDDESVNADDDDDDDEYEDDEEEDEDNEDHDEFENAKPILVANEPAKGHVKQKTKMYTKDYHVGRNLPYHRNHGIKTPEHVKIKNYRKLNNVNMKALRQHSLTHKINADDDVEGTDSKDKAVLDDDDEGVDDDNSDQGEYSQKEQNEDEPNDDEINEDESNEEGDENEEGKVSMNENADVNDIAEKMKCNECTNPKAPEIASVIKSKMCPTYIMVVALILAILLLTCGCYFLFWLCLHRALAVESRATLQTDPLLCACYSDEGSNPDPGNAQSQ